MSQLKQQRRLDFDVIRIFACLTILIIHFNASVSGYDYSGTFLYPNELIPNWYFGCVYLGEIGNSLFFMLSGASLMCSSSGLELDSAKKVGTFYWKRIKALMPMFWIAWLGATVVTLLANKMISGASWHQLLWSLCGMDGYAIAHGWGGLFYQVGEWYLGCALLCYLVWPAVTWLWRKLPLPAFLGVVSIGYIYSAISTNGSGLSVVIRLTEMIAGGCFVKHIKSAKNVKVFGVSALVAVLCVLGQSRLTAMTVSFAVVWLIFLLISLLVECLPTFFESLAPMITSAAALTYPLFLVHHKLIALLAAQFSLEYFPYRYTVVLFAGYIVISVCLAKILKCAGERAVDFVSTIWRAVFAARAKKHVNELSFRIHKRTKCVIKKIRTQDLIFSLLCVLTVSLFPALFLYAQNASEASFSEIVYPMILFAGVAIVLFAVISLFMCGRLQQAAVVTAISMLALLNFTSIENLLVRISAELRYWHCLLIVIFVLVHIGILISMKLSDEWAGYGVRILAGVFGFLILMNVGMAAPSIVKKVSSERELAEKRTELLAQQNESDDYLPNIYYIMLDEYSGFNTIKNVLGYDNDAFAEYLEDLGFTVSRDSYNEEIATVCVTANLFDLSYKAVYGETSTEELNALRQNGTLINLLVEQGYQLQGIGSGSSLYGLERVDTPNGSTSATTVSGETLETLLLNKSVFYPFASVEVNELQQDVLSAFAYISDGDNFPDQGMFSIMHVNAPHEPFIFDKDGGFILTSDWTDTGYYWGQYQYITKLTEEAISKIVSQDPNAIIILQSDHGARAVSNPELFMRLIPYADIKNILNAVYIGGESFEEMQGQSGVNTLRLLCNRLFRTEFEILEVPNGVF